MLAELILWAVLMGKDCRLLHRYSSDPNQRMQELLDESENLRQIQDEIKRFWMNDQPTHLTPDRTHGSGRDGESSEVQLPSPPASGPASSPNTTKRKGFTIHFTFSLSIGAEPSEPKPEPVRGMLELMHESENLRQIQKEVEQFWFNDQPSHLTPDRTHGGVR